MRIPLPLFSKGAPPPPPAQNFIKTQFLHRYNGTPGQTIDLFDVTEQNVLTPQIDALMANTDPVAKFGTACFRAEPGFSNNGFSTGFRPELSPDNHDFCIETWVYFDALPPSGNTFIAVASAGFNNSVSIGIQPVAAASQLAIIVDDGNTFNQYFVPGVYTTGVWIHMALSRNGNTITAYKNGVVVDTRALADLSFTDSDFGVRGILATGMAIDDTRVVIRDPVYTAPFPVPVLPLPIFGPFTAFLHNFEGTDGQLVPSPDDTGRNVINVIRGELSTDNPKFGTACFRTHLGTFQQEFDTDKHQFLSMANKVDFCLEFWVTHTIPLGTASNVIEIFDGDAPTFLGMNIDMFSNGLLNIRFDEDGANQSISTTLPVDNTGTEYTHVAITRDGPNFRVFIGGDTDTIVPALDMIIPSQTFDLRTVFQSNTYNIRIDCMRYVVGSPVYTEDFIPSETALTEYFG